jgi:hypothetical protein
MDNPLQQQESQSRQPGGFPPLSLQIFDSILQWLTGILQLTEEEQDDAGIYLDRPEN